MKYSMDTYRLYSNEKIFTFSVRVKVRMKDDVDIDILRRSVNMAAKRYPYFMVEVALGDDGGYNLIPNEREVVVLQTPAKLPELL